MALYKEFEQQGNLLFRYRGLIPILFLGVAVLAFVLQVSNNDPDPTRFQWFWFVAFGISLFGLLIRANAVGRAAPNTSGRNTKKQVADCVNKSGLYSIIRHPLYVGNFFMWMGVALLTANGWFILFFIFLYVVYYERIMFAEEQFLIGKFGDEYTNWSVETPAVLPRMSHYKPSVNSFSVRRVLKQEITGLLLLCVMFLFFDQIYEFFAFQSLELNMDIWLMLCLGVGLLYTVIKIIQKTTSLLKT